jgi:PASTA domain-containing protein
VPGGIRSLAIASALALVFVASASSANWGGKDPPENTPIRRLPSSCNAAPTGKQCIDAGVWYLDRARAKVGLPAYALPANFPSLSPPQQVFILVNLDRVQYGLRPITGLTAALSHAALVSGVRQADDPHPSNTTGLNTWWPGWAGAFHNAPMAYEAWVWNDGLGSTNPRCTPTDHSRCWGHRHSVLWKYGPVLAMGAAAGRDSRHHRRGYAYLFVGGDAGYTPTYTYTWEQAVADGAGTNAYDPGPSPRSMCHVPVVIGMKLRGATRAIEKGHCTVGEVVRKHNHYVPGIVTRQYPRWGKTLATGTSIGLTVSLGPR